MHDPYYLKRLSRSRQERKTRQRVRPLSEEIQETSRMLLITISCLLVVVSGSFLWVSSIQSAKGYQLQQLQSDYEQLLIDNRELQNRLTQAQSITNLQELEEVESMFEATNEEFSYVDDGNNGFALR